MTFLHKICDLLEHTEKVEPILQKLALSARRTFAIAAPYVKKTSEKYNMAQKIIKATTCSTTGLKIVSWNIDSLRARIIDSKTAKYKGIRTIKDDSPMRQLLDEVNPDIICLQETKLKPEDIKNLNIQGFYTYWNCSTRRKGYSGVAIWSKIEPISVSTDLINLTGTVETEGRILTAYYDGFVLVNTYVPNTLRAGVKPRRGWDAIKNPTKRSKRRMDYQKYVGSRILWDKAILMHLEKLRKDIGNVIWCGDLNVAYSPLDIHNGVMTEEKLQKAIKEGTRPSRIKALQKRLNDATRNYKLGGGAGFRLEEREGLREIFRAGFIDVYRTLYPNKFGFTYWDRTKKAFRKANNGWRIDYFIVSPELLNCIRNISVLKDIGVTHLRVPSDHAPVVITF